MNQNNNPLVSIIVITYNSAKFVLETLESAKAQTYQNIELIISDDCSSDNTVEICKKWLKDNKDRFVNTELITAEKNTGIPANCNRGVKASNGDWIKIIAGDDILLPDCIKKNVAYIDRNPQAYLVFSKIKTFGKKDKSSEIRPNNGFLFHDLDAVNQFKTLLKGNIISYTPSGFLKKTLFDKIGYFVEKYKLIEDYPYWLKATKNGYKLFFIDELTVLYRIHDDSIYHSQLKSNAKNIGKIRLRMVSVRKDLVYPYFSVFKLSNELYQDFIAKVFTKLPENINLDFLYFFFTKYFNPFLYISFIMKRLFKYKNLDFNF